MPIMCPACGSDAISTSYVDSSILVPYGPTATFVETVYTCGTCGVSADFTGENDGVIKAALEKSGSASVVSMLDFLAARGITQAGFERRLRLPIGTTERWKTGELSAPALALLRLVRTFPWLLEVADANFEYVEEL